MHQQGAIIAFDFVDANGVVKMRVDATPGEVDPNGGFGPMREGQGYVRFNLGGEDQQVELTGCGLFDDPMRP